MSTFNRILIGIPLLATMSFLSGCAAPGSSITQAGISGRIVDSQGRGIAGRQVEVGLPASYGLAGLDAVWSKPEDYGHRSAHARLQTDADGRFTYLFPPNTYSIALWLLPPLGVLPRQPPKPFIVIRTASISPDFFVTGTDHGHFDCRVWDHTTGRVRADTNTTSRVSGSYSLAKSERNADGRGRARGWQMDVVVIEP